MKIFEVAGVGKLHGLTVMSLDSFVNKDEKEVEESAVKTVHRIGLTVTDPNHPMVSKRGETYQKSVRVTGDDREKAINSAIAHYRRKGYKVHDHHYMGTVEPGVAEGSGDPEITPGMKTQYGTVVKVKGNTVIIKASNGELTTMNIHDIQQGVAEGDSGAKYKIRIIGRDSKGDYYISPSTGKKVYKSGVKRGDHENPKTGEHKGVAEGNLKEFAPGPGGDDDSGEDPYRYPKPEHFSRSVDFFGQFEADHFDQEDMNDATGEFKGYWGKDQVAYFKFDNPKRTGSDDPGMGWYYEPNTGSDNNNAKPTPAVDNADERKQQQLGMIDAFLKSGQKPKPGSQIHSLMKQLGLAEGNNVTEGADPGLLFYAKIPDGSRVYARVKDAEHLANLQQEYRGSEIKTFDFRRPDILDWLEARGINLRKFTLGMVQTMYPGSRGHNESTDLNERASQLLSAQDRNGVITVVVQAPDGTKRSLADENPRYINQWLMKYDLSLPKSITSKFVENELSEAPGDFGLGANYRAVPDAEMQDLMGRSKNKTKTKRDKYDYPYIHGSNIEVKDEAGKTFDTEALKKSIMVRPASILGQNAKMQHSETGEEAIFDIGLPALKGLAVNEKTGEFVVVDTCPGAGECKTFCYAMKGSYVMFKAVSMGLARMLNFLLNDPEGFANKLNAEITAAKAKMAKKNAKVVVRWHDAGDFFSAEYLDMAYSVANANPDVGFYAYTKMGDVATGARPKNFNMNFSGGALSSQEKKIDFKRVKHSKVVPKDMFFDLIARDGNNLKKDAKGRMQFASPANLEQFKSTMAQKYAIDRDSILTYDEMMKTPVGDTPKWNTIVMPGDGDNSANRNDVIGSYLLFH